VGELTLVSKLRGALAINRPSSSLLTVFRCAAERCIGCRGCCVRFSRVYLLSHYYSLLYVNPTVETVLRLSWRFFRRQSIIPNSRRSAIILSLAFFRCVGNPTMWSPSVGDSCSCFCRGVAYGRRVEPYRGRSTAGPDLVGGRVAESRGCDYLLYGMMNMVGVALRRWRGCTY
jgi:hypothetical protein